MFLHVSRYIYIYKEELAGHPFNPEAISHHVYGILIYLKYQIPLKSTHINLALYICKFKIYKNSGPLEVTMKSDMIEIDCQIAK
jgi:hypothetical protein